MDAPARVTQEEGHTGFLHLPSAVLALIFIARGSSCLFPSSSEVEYVYPRINRSPLVGHIYIYALFFCEDKSQFV